MRARARSAVAALTPFLAIAITVVAHSAKRW